MNSIKNYEIISKKKVDTEEACCAILVIHRSVAWEEGDDRLSIRRLQEPQNLSYFIRKNASQEIVAYITAKPIKNGYYVSFIAVKSEEQGQKYGTVLMQKIFDKAIKKGGSELHLDFEGDKPQNYHFYDKFSYPHQIEHTSTTFYSGSPRYQVVYNLKG